MENFDDGSTGGQQSNPFRKTNPDKIKGSESLTKLPEIVSQRSSITLNNKDSKKLRDDENFKFGSAPNS